MKSSNSFLVPFAIFLVSYAVFSVFLIGDVEAQSQARQLPGIKCISRYPEGSQTCSNGNCNFFEPNHVFQLGCDVDCTSSHGALYGMCLPNDVCKCGAPVYSPGKASFQCLDIKKAEFFQTVCDEDCRCTHNAIGGGCNFFTKACQCGPTSKNSVFADCPYKSSNEYFINLLQKYKTIGINVAELLGGA